MKLQLESIDIRDVRVGSQTCVNEHILFINPHELEELILKDPEIKSLKLDIVHPGDRVRIVNVVDVIQPRCRIDRDDGDFPGWLGKMTIAGEGIKRSLRGVSIVLCNRSSKRPYSGLIDMFGPGSEMSVYGGMKNIVIDAIPSENSGEREFENAVKVAGLKTAVYLANVSRGQAMDDLEVYELNIASLRNRERGNLPKIAYYYQLYTPQHDYQGLSDFIFYGGQVTNILPTIIHPNEVLDGAIVNSGTIRGMETYRIQNHAVIKELYKRHGKELFFAGVVVGVACLEETQRQRMSVMTANLVANVLGADGVILSKVHGGMPHIDLGAVAETCENYGVKTTLFAQVWSSLGSLSDYVLFEADSLDAIVSIGNNLEKVCLPEANEILGGNSETVVYNPERIQKAADAVEIETFLIAGAFDYLGGTKIIAAEY